jgi:AraC family transcriptional regulator, alkane utilization regulator
MTEKPNLPLSPLIEDVLRRVRLASAMYLRGEFAAPWSLYSADQDALAQVVAPGAKRLVVLHLAIEGSFRIALPTGESALVKAGEAVVLPYCDVHSMGSPEIVQPVAVVTLLPKPPWTELPVVARIDGDGTKTRIMCGFLHCDDMLFDPILRALPRLIHLGSTGSAAQWREASLRYTLERAGFPGSSELSARIPEMVLVDCLRQYVEALPPAQAGWLAALKDPIVGPAIARLHAAPAETWSVTRLARELAVSRSVLAERFTDAIGQPPMRYLAQWRMQLAADFLRTTTLSLAEIATRVGYESEAAFSRAFKRRFASSPATRRPSS